MAGTTPNYALPYQQLGDAPNGAQGLQDLATAVDTQLLRMDTVGKVTLMTGSGNFVKTVSPVPRWVKVQLQASGGGSGGGLGGANHGESGAGGGGGYVEKVYAASALSASEPLVIGGAGTAGASGNNAGGNASNATFKALTAGGGQGGSGSGVNQASQAAQGGAGGTAAGGDINIPGGKGGNGRVITGVAVLASQGGNSVLGNPSSPTVGAAVGTSSLYGTGACGTFVGGANLAGAVGALGVAMFTEYF